MSSTTPAHSVTIDTNSTPTQYQSDVDRIFAGLDTKPPTDHYFITELTDRPQTIVNTFHIHPQYLSVGHPIVWNDEFMPLKSHSNAEQLKGHVGRLQKALEEKHLQKLETSTGPVNPEDVHSNMVDLAHVEQDIEFTRYMLGLVDICDQYYMPGNTEKSFKVEGEEDSDEESEEEEEEEEGTDTEEEETQVYTPGPSDIASPITQGATPGDDDGTEGFGNLSIQDPGHSEA